ncbi:PfkB family carbohydrate kinase [Pinisolibacter aquiterrae]|uniref:PfkB family carbohydrate kinase n=1 Tax=Pinisolibacter aquiterrae TaxID=2815579 RepID=UPI001C3CCAA1|nr:ribokinase [Pinisolibacter aquiterrae]MCC8234853.1 PfkB family carbohydrate kinase [Pinisolibacter aquiterrae]
MIVVFGTLNVDLVIVVPRLPAPGEGVKGGDHQLFPGGKGGNQALAAALAGARVALVGAVGGDGFAATALAGLAEAGVDLSGVARSDRPTGLQTIAVDPTGENLMTGSTAANADASPQALAPLLGPGVTLLTQTSIGLRAVETAIALARTAGARVVLNAAPAIPPAEATLAAVDVLIVNAHEAASLAEALGLPGEAMAFAVAAARRFMATVVVTLGPRGLVAATPEGDRLDGAPPEVAVVDTTGAGDALIGAIAAALDRGAPLEIAFAEGLAAGSLACRETGARSSFASRSAIGRLAATIAIRRTTGGAA